MLVLFLLTTVNYSRAQTTGGVFYSVTGNGSKDTSWLFGTYHLINESYLSDIPKVQYAFDKSSQVVVEVILNPEEMNAANAKTQLQNKTLSDLLDKAFTDSLDSELKTTTGQGIASFQTLKPMTVLLTLSMVNLVKDNQAILQRYKGLPLDAAFAANGKAKGKKITALETIGEQMDFLFNHFPDEVQASMLKDFLRNKETNIQLSNELLKIYFNNNIDSIYRIYQQTNQLTNNMDFLITGRNQNWMKQLPDLFKTQSSFVAVGALHLAGPDGLVTQLRNQGYTVTPLNLK